MSKGRTKGAKNRTFLQYIENLWIEHITGVQYWEDYKHKKYEATKKNNK